MKNDIILKAYDGEVSKFCRTCGRKLQRGFFPYVFDTETGKQVYHYYIICPIRFARLRGHEYAEFDSHGNEVISRNYM